MQKIDKDIVWCYTLCINCRECLKMTGKKESLKFNNRKIFFVSKKFLQKCQKGAVVTDIIGLVSDMFGGKPLLVSKKVKDFIEKQTKRNCC